MAQQPPPIYFEDIPLAQARAMGRGPRMDPELYHTLKEKIESSRIPPPASHFLRI
jgi:hypothetical protein